MALALLNLPASAALRTLPRLRIIASPSVMKRKLRGLAEAADGSLVDANRNYKRWTVLLTQVTNLSQQRSMRKYLLLLCLQWQAVRMQWIISNCIQMPMLLLRVWVALGKALAMSLPLPLM